MDEGYLHYFDWEMYLIVVMSYSFGFMGGWVHAWVLPISLIFFATPFYLRNKRIEKGVNE